jgi:hypothetical protein
MARNMSSVRFPLFFLGLFMIEVGGLLYHFMNISENLLVMFAAIGFIIYLISLVAPWSKKQP